MWGKPQDEEGKEKYLTHTIDPGLDDGKLWRKREHTKTKGYLEFPGHLEDGVRSSIFIFICPH